MVGGGIGRSPGHSKAQGQEPQSAAFTARDVMFQQSTELTTRGQGRGDRRHPWLHELNHR